MTPLFWHWAIVANSPFSKTPCTPVSNARQAADVPPAPRRKATLAQKKPPVPRFRALPKSGYFVVLYEAGYPRIVVWH